MQNYEQDWNSKASEFRGEMTNEDTFFCNTNYQLIVAVQIALSFNKSGSIIITNEIKNYENIVKNLRKTKLFEQVACIDVKTVKKSITLTIQCILGMVPKEIKKCIFDEFVGFNLDIPSHIVYAFFYKKNKDIVVNKMEEGVMFLTRPRHPVVCYRRVIKLDDF